MDAGLRDLFEGLGGLGKMCVGKDADLYRSHRLRTPLWGEKGLQHRFGLGR